MAFITLAELSKRYPDGGGKRIIDEMEKSTLLTEMIFDTTVSKAGQSFKYLIRRVSERIASKSREMNTEFNLNRANTEDKVVTLDIVGNKVPIDRLTLEGFKNMTVDQINDELTFQLLQSIASTSTKFDDMIINAKVGTDKFDGLLASVVAANKFDTAMDLTTITKEADEAFLNLFDEAVNAVAGGATHVLMHPKFRGTMNRLQRNQGVFYSDKDGFGKQALYYDGKKIIYTGEVASADGINTENIIKKDATSEAYPIIAVNFKDTGVVGVTLKEEIIIPYFPTINLTNMTSSLQHVGSEIAGAIAVQNSRAISVLTSIKV